MKKIFKKLFSVDRIDLIKKNLKTKNPISMEIGVHRGEFSKELFILVEFNFSFATNLLIASLEISLVV